MIDYQPIIQQIALSPGHLTDILRLDLIHPEISGNKWFKLKYNIDHARKSGTLLTFGGAFSNHILATAVACKLAGIRSIGIIRGEKTSPLNSTLEKAHQNGMQLEFMSREDYAQKEDKNFLDALHKKYGEFLLVPEGGHNEDGVRGCKEILFSDWDHDYILCACGTGTTFMGLLEAAKPEQIVIGINVLKGENSIVAEINSSIKKENRPEVKGNEELLQSVITHSCITDEYAFKGYAKYDRELVEFKRQFEKHHHIPLDYVYTNKLFFAADALMRSKKIPAGSRVLIIHSGGLQGNSSFEKRFRLA